MRMVSMILFATGFLLAALVTVAHADSEGLRWQTVNWTYYGLTFAICLAGVVGLRTTAAKTGSEQEKTEGELEDLHASLARLVRQLDTLIADSEKISVYDVHVRIDEALVDDLGIFADARESMIPRYGIEAYADIMSLFASGERRINRAWSASADGYVDEVWTCVSAAETQMKSALTLFEQHRSAAT